MNKITCICLGVRDMGRSVALYRDELGFKTDCVEDSPRVCFFDTPGTKFELYPLDLLAQDICPHDPFWEVVWGPDFKYDKTGMLAF